MDSNNSALQVFEYDGSRKVRTIDRDGEVWFVGKDVAEILGYIETAKAIREHVEEEDKGVSVLDTPGGKQSMTIINESGLYSLILSSKRPNAKKFKRWVTHKVLPAIRKTGAYAVNGDIQNHIRKLEAENKLLHEKVDAMLEQLAESGLLS